MIYNIGDIVYVRNDLNMETTYIAEDDFYEEIVVPDMMEFKGKYVVISDVDEDWCKYYIAECDWCWVSSMFDGTMFDRTDPGYSLSIDLSEFV